MKLFYKIIIVVAILVFLVVSLSLFNYAFILIKKQLLNFDLEIKENSTPILAEDEDTYLIVQKNQAFNNPDSPFAMTFLIKKQIDLKHDDILFRIKKEYSEDFIEVEAEIINDLIRINRNITDEDIIFIDKNGNIVLSSETVALKNTSGYKISPSGRLLSSVETVTSNLAYGAELLIKDLDENTTLTTSLVDIISKEDIISDFFFSDDEQTIIIVLYNETGNFFHAHEYDFREDDFVNEIVFKDSVFITYFNSNYYTISITDNTYYLKKLTLEEETIIAESQTEISNIIPTTNFVYFQIGADIYRENNITPKMIIGNAKLTYVSKKNEFIIYERIANFQKTKHTMIHNLKTNTSKELFINTFSSEMDNYKFIGEI